MKIKRNSYQLIIVITILTFSIYVAKASGTPVIQWNEKAQSVVLNSSELAKLGGAFSLWRTKQMIWPSSSEINSRMVTVDPNVRSECQVWLSKFITNEQLPVNFEKQLVPMKGWGVIRKDSEQRRLCDVFITRYRKGDHVVHIQESPYNVIITVADEQFADKSTVNHKDYVIEIADLFLENALKPDPASENFHLSSHNGITHVTWAIDSLRTINSKGEKVLDLVKAGEVGTKYVDAETNGMFVIFEILKCPGAVKRGFFDPYVERFSVKKSATE